MNYYLTAKYKIETLLINIFQIQNCEKIANGALLFKIKNSY